MKMLPTWPAGDRGAEPALAAVGAGLLAKDTGVPKAYLNCIFFDAEMNTKATNFKQVSEAAHGSFVPIAIGMKWSLLPKRRAI